LWPKRAEHDQTQLTRPGTLNSNFRTGRFWEILYRFPPLGLLGHPLISGGVTLTTDAVGLSLIPSLDQLDILLEKLIDQGVQVYDREAEMDRNRRQALEMLRVGMGADVKLVTFTKEASYGTYGTPSYMVYGAIVPAFSKYLGAIAEAEFGEALELDGEP